MRLCKGKRLAQKALDTILTSQRHIRRWRGPPYTMTTISWFLKENMSDPLNSTRATRQRICGSVCYWQRQTFEEASRMQTSRSPGSARAHDQCRLRMGLLCAHRYDQMVDQGRRTLELDPISYQHCTYWGCEHVKGVHEPAIAAFQKAVDLLLCSMYIAGLGWPTRMREERRCADNPGAVEQTFGAPICHGLPSGLIYAALQKRRSLSLAGNCYRSAPRGWFT